MVRPFGKLLGRLIGSGAAGITAVSITLLRPQSFSACAEDDKTQVISVAQSFKPMSRHPITTTTNVTQSLMHRQ